MAFCANCGFENADDYVFCESCGAKRADEPAGEAPKMAYAPQSVQTDSTAQASNPASSDKTFGSQSCLIDPDEKVIAQLGNGYLTSFISKGQAGYMNATLTDRRVYLKGKFQNGGRKLSAGSGKSFFKRNILDQILDVRDVTGTWFEYRDNLLPLILGIFFGVCGIITLLASTIVFIGGDIESGALTLAVFAGIAIVCVANILGYLKSRTTVFCIEYAGGVIRFNADIVGTDAVRDFHKQLRRIKDRHMDLLEGRR